MTTWLWEEYVSFDFENIIQPSIPMGLYKHNMTGFANAEASSGMSSYDPWRHILIFTVFRYYRPFGGILGKLTTEGEEKKVAGFLNQYSVTKCWNLSLLSSTHVNKFLLNTAVCVYFSLWCIKKEKAKLIWIKAENVKIKYYASTENLERGKGSTVSSLKKQ